MRMRTIKKTVIAPVLVLAILLQPLTPVMSHNALAAPKTGHTPRANTLAPMVTPDACQLRASLYLPAVMTSGSAALAAADANDAATPAGARMAAAGPEFTIISPNAGGAISGILYVAVQAADPAAITSVTFCAGETVLGTDSTPADGFKLFLDADTLPPGPIEVIALASGPGGQALRSINVTVVANPPATAVVGSGGGVVASEIGSIITVPPGAVPEDTTVSVTEKTQEEVTAENGIDWDAMGVTFLGAQDVQSTADFAKPLGVSSAGFGNRVQPGQAVVNYRIIPDADGDGVDEIVVVNTASVAPNNDVVADPVPQIHLYTYSTISSYGSSAGVVTQGSISGQPGTMIEFQAMGFNPLSIGGNVAIFESLVDDTVYN